MPFDHHLFVSADHYSISLSLLLTVGLTLHWLVCSRKHRDRFSLSHTHTMAMSAHESASFDDPGRPSARSLEKSRNETADVYVDVPTKKSSQFICSFVVIYTLLFFNGCCFTAVAPSVPFYLEFLNAPPTFLGWVVSSYSLGQIFGSPLAGRLSNDLSSKRLLLISSYAGLFSSFLYAVAPGYVYVLLSRLLTGLSAGFELTTELTFIANNTSMSERTAFMASVTACNVLGFIVGPTLSSALAMLDLQILGLRIDQYTGPGWLLAAMFFLSLILLQLFFTDQTRLGAEPSCKETGLSDNNRSEKLLSSDNGADRVDDVEATIPQDSVYSGGDNYIAYEDDGPTQEPPPALLLVLILIFVQFSVMCGFSLLETITSPLVEDEFGWTVQDCNLLLTCGGVFSLTVYLASLVASKRVQDRQQILAALVFCSFGFLLAVDWSRLDWVPTQVLPPLPYRTRFLISVGLVYGGFMTGRPILFALYSKLIPQQYQGQYLGWMVAGGSAARTLGPFFAVYFYYEIRSGNNLFALFGSIGLLHVACILLVLYQWQHLLPVVLERPSSSTKNTP